MGLHTLRHTYCSHLARQNVRAELRAKLVGHRVLAMQNIYTHTTQEDALAAGREFTYNQALSGAGGTGGTKPPLDASGRVVAS